MLLAPLYDFPTRSASGFLIRYVLPRSVPPQLIGPTVRKQPFQMLTIGDTIIGVGHGSPSEFCGHNDQVIMDTLSIPDVKDKVVILISCETAKELGPAIIQAGAASYIGFKEDMVWICDSDLAAIPWADKTFAAPCLMPIFNCVNAVLDGKPTGEAFDMLIEDLARNALVEEDDLIRSCINFNKKNAVLLGSPEARVAARPKILLPLPPPPIFLPLTG